MKYLMLIVAILLAPFTFAHGEVEDTHVDEVSSDQIIAEQSESNTLSDTERHLVQYGLAIIIVGLGFLIVRLYKKRKK